MRDDDDKTRDRFTPGVTQDQIRKAEEMLGGLDLPTFIEKRDLAGDYHTGVLQPMGSSGEAYDVKVSVSPVEGERRHVLLSREPLPATAHAQISIRRFNTVRTLSGRVVSGHEGRREEDKLNGDRLKVSFFYPDGR